MRTCLLLPIAVVLLAGMPVPAAGSNDTGATLHRGLGPEPDSLHIHQAQGLPALQILRDIYEGLLTFDAAGRLVGGVAEAWELSADGLELSLQLRSDATWSNGDRVVAGDFVRAWQAAVAPATQARTASLLAPVRQAQKITAGEADPSTLGIQALDDGQLRISLAQPAPWFLEVLAHPVSFPMHPDANDQRLVNGAFAIAEMVPQSHIRLERNPGFHGAGSVRLQTVWYYPVEDPGAELSRYRSGELDITETIPPGRYAWLRENLGDELRISPYLGSFWLGLNLRRPPFQDSAELRRALALAIDRETLSRVVLGAGETPAWSVVPTGIDGYQPPADPAAEMPAGERLALARELYARAGYGDDRPLRVELRFNTSTQHRRMAVAVAAMWKQALGVRTELVQEEWKVFVNNRSQGAITQVFRGGWIADYADPASFLDLFRGGEALNNTFYHNPRFDQLLSEAAVLPGEQRLQMLQQAEALLLSDTPVIPLYQYVSRHLVKPRVGGFVDNLRDTHLSRYLFVQAPQ